MGSKEENQATDTGLKEEDLVKALDQLDEFVSSNDKGSRKDELLKKAMSEELGDEEREELFGLMGGTPAPDSRGEEIVKSFQENEDFQKAFEVSDFLREQHDELTKSLSTLADYQERSEQRQHEFNLALARTVSDTGKLVKAMSERLGVIERQPVRGPKAVRTKQDQIMQKSFQDGSESDTGKPPGPQMNRRSILKGLEGMMVKSMGSGDDGLADCGEDISVAVATFEQTNQISKPMLEEVKQHLAAGQ
jgi:hypothetical protein